MTRNPRDGKSADRTELPIERGFPIERVNEIAEKESRAKQYYRPVYTMHKWWARRPGCLFRAISLYSLLDDETDESEVSVYEPGENQTLGTNGIDEADLLRAVSEVDMEDPESLWEFYPKDVRVKDKKVLDPFMGGGTSLVEASRFGAETVGYDLNPVAWFVTKKELEAGQTDPEKLQEAFEQVKEDVAEELRSFYRTPCPNGDHEAEAVNNFWVRELNCVSCGETVPLFKNYRVAKARYVDGNQYYVFCPGCGSVSLVDDWKSETECDCGTSWVPKDGPVSRGYYTCQSCGQKEAISEATQSQGIPEAKLYAIEYYCGVCDENGRPKKVHKGYKEVDSVDSERVLEAEKRWEQSTELREWVPDEKIPSGYETVERRPLFDHGYTRWTDMFLPRQLLCLATLLKRISEVEDTDAREYLLLAFSDSLMFQSTFTIYNQQRNNMEGVFRLNSFVPQTDFVENNVWGAEFGRGNFRNTWEKLLNGVTYANAPTDRYIESGDIDETEPFSQPIGNNADVHRGDMRDMDAEDEYDMVLTDPPYYDNIMYSELSDYFYVWQKLLLENDYDGFEQEKTPRADSIVTNPHLGKTEADFEEEMRVALETINTALKDDGSLAFTYHHSDEESWGELLGSLCDSGFEVTATYPISSDLSKFIEAREAVSFDIVIVARPTDERQPISWNALRRRIVRTAMETREVLEENRDLKGGDIGVIEMGKCFQEYSKHHGEVRRGQDTMTAKEVVQEIYGIIQDNTRGEQAVYLDLLEEHDPSYDDLNKHLRHADASQDQLEEMNLVRTDSGGLSLLDWRDEGRQAYVQDRVDAGDATTLDKAHFLRYRFEQGKETSPYLEQWSDDDLTDICEGLAEATGDETYLKLVGVDSSLDEYLNR
ncbi:DUF1156 domain-containing protein [Halarchaeum sp. P4]|uniref:DUF1156 domain-containing protein n=1 Tax=Halarchaeum sp. P4 TaxID=3421639 RepID=UPI003EBC4B82